MGKQCYDVPQLEVYLMKEEDVITVSGEKYNKVDDGAQPDFFSW